MGGRNLDDVQIFIANRFNGTTGVLNSGRVFRFLRFTHRFAKVTLTSPPRVSLETACDHHQRRRILPRVAPPNHSFINPPGELGGNIAARVVQFLSEAQIRRLEDVPAYGPGHVI
jgi:hypothetical protein